MIMPMTWGKLRAGPWAEYEQAYHATVAGKTVPGLRGRWLAQDVQDPDGGFAVSVWDALDAMQAYEQSAVFRQEIQPTLQPFCVGEYTTSRCEVKDEQYRRKRLADRAEARTSLLDVRWSAGRQPAFSC
jgi:heme-degrading monooxygenase HmoA